MQLAIFHCGGAMTPERVITQGAPWRRRFLPLMAFALRDAGRLLLVDAPFARAGLPVMGGLRRFLYGALGGVRVGPQEHLAARLDQLGWGTPEEGVFTHMHFDHVAGLDEVPQVHWRSSPRGLAHLQGMSPRYSLTHGYLDPSWWAGRQVSALPMEGAQVEPFGACADLWGDGKVLLVPLEGHAIGHLGLLVQLADKRVFLCGDAVYQASHITQGREPGIMAHRSAEDHDQMLRTVELLRRFHRENPEVELIPSHDFAWGERCRQAPVLWGEA